MALVSNVSDSKESRVGLYKTTEVYTEIYERSSRLDELEQGFNEKVRERTIVIHGALYATEQYIEEHVKAGRS
jgi:hypothetical protein